MLTFYEATLAGRGGYFWTRVITLTLFSHEIDFKSICKHNGKILLKLYLNVLVSITEKNIIRILFHCVMYFVPINFRQRLSHISSENTFISWTWSVMLKKQFCQFCKRHLKGPLPRQFCKRLKFEQWGPKTIKTIRLL